MLTFKNIPIESVHLQTMSSEKEQHIELNYIELRRKKDRNQFIKINSTANTICLRSTKSLSANVDSEVQN